MCKVVYFPSGAEEASYILPIFLNRTSGIAVSKWGKLVKRRAYIRLAQATAADWPGQPVWATCTQWNPINLKCEWQLCFTCTTSNQNATRKDPWTPSVGRKILFFLLFKVNLPPIWRQFTRWNDYYYEIHGTTNHQCNTMRLFRQKNIVSKCS